MKASIFLLCAALTFCCTISNAQLLEKTKKGYKYIYEYNSDTEILNLLKDYPQALESYQESKRDRKIANILGGTSLLSIAVAAFSFPKIDQPGFGDPNVGYLLTSFGAGLLAIVTGMTGLNFSGSATKKKNEDVVNFYNQALTGRPIKVSIQPVSNGVGLVLTF